MSNNSKIYPNNYAPQTERSLIAHQPGQKEGEKISDGRDYTFEFDDSLMSYVGWTNPRHDGCITKALFINKFSPPNTPQTIGGFKHPHIQSLANVTQSWSGDINVDKTPVLHTYTTSIFYGATIAGFDEDPRYPGVGPDFSSIFINKIYTFDPDTDEFFITEILDGCIYDEIFERVLKQDMRYADKFQLRILDNTTEHDLKNEYTVHYNRGLFSKLATFTTCSDSPYSHEMQINTQYTPYCVDGSNYASNRDYYGLTVSSSQNIVTQNQVLFFWNAHNRVDITGSFEINISPDTWWWRKPQSSSFFQYQLGGGSNQKGMRGNTSLEFLKPRADGVDSVYNFLSRLFARKGGRIVDPSSAESQFNTSLTDDLVICTFNRAEKCDRRIQTEQRYGKNITQALRHFGSISLSNGREIGVPNISLRSPEFAKTNAEGYYINSKIVGPSFTEYVTCSLYPSYSIHDTSSGVPPTLNHIYYTWFNNASSSAYTALNECPDEAIQVEAPRLKRYDISQLKKRSNIIMTDINKNEELFDGVGANGFVLIHEDLHPTIKTNLDYYLCIAGLIDLPNGCGTKVPVPYWSPGGRIITTPRPWYGDWWDNIGQEDPCD